MSTVREPRRVAGAPRAVTGLAAICVVLVVAGVASFVVRGAPLQELFDAWVFHNAPIGLVGTVVFAAALRRQPDNRAAWLFFASGVVSTIHVSAMAWAYAAGERVPGLWAAVQSGDAALRELPAVVRWPLWIAVSVWLLAPGLATSLSLLFFPDGELPSRRWRPVVGLAVVGMTIGAAAWSWSYRPSTSIAVPINSLPVFDPVGRILFLVGMPLLALATLLTAASLVARLRAAEAAEVRRIRPVLITGLLFVAVMVLLYPWQALWATASIPAVALFLATLAASVGRYRLFDVEMVVSRAVALAVLGTAVTLAYVGLVAGLGGVLGTSSNLWLSVAVTALIAVAFEPLRRRVMAVAVQLVQGTTTTPQEVLSRLSLEGLATATTPDDVLTQVVDLLLEGTGATRVEVWSSTPEGLRLDAVAGAASDDAARRSCAVTDAGELLGDLRLLAERDGQFLPSDDRLLRQVAATLGPVLRNARLTRQLRHHIDALEASRQRILAAHDEARRSLERDIHDGAQQRLLSLRLKLGLLSAQAHQAGDHAGAAPIDEVAAEADEAIRQLRDLARGLYPPVLAEQGLEPALRAHARVVPVPVTVRSPGLARHDRALEAAVYFCCLEALQNVSRHARATSVCVRLTDRDGNLSFEVVDDGCGFDPGAVSGTGLANLRDRVEALGGTLEVVTSPGAGTVVRGRVPTGAGDRTHEASAR